MKGPSPAFQFYAKDWIADTAGLTLEAQGAYMRLLAHIWVEGPLEDDGPSLARRLGLEPKGKRFNAIWREISPLFQVAGGTIKNKRLEQERAKQVAYREDQALRGKHGATKRWAMAPAIPNAIAPAMPAPMPTAQPDDGFSFPTPTTEDRSLLEASNLSGPGSDEKPDPDVVRMRFKRVLEPAPAQGAA